MDNRRGKSLTWSSWTHLQSQVVAQKLYRKFGGKDAEYLNTDLDE